MSFHANSEWDVRTTGNDANGGGWQVGSTGTDYSQQDAAQHAYTDLVIDGATNTKITSAARAFTGVDVGNIINVTAGTGFTVQRIQIVSVDGSNIATCDKAVGTVGSTDGVGNLGGSLATIATAQALAVAYNVVHIKAGTYTQTATITWAAGPVNVVGYSSAHWDWGTKPLITTATDSTILFKLNAVYDGGHRPIALMNLSFSNTASVRANGVNSNGDTRGVFYRCAFDGFAVAIGRTAGVWIEFTGIELEVKNSTDTGIVTQGNSSDHSNQLINCYIHDNANYGVVVTNHYNFTALVAQGCIFANNGADGVYFNVTSGFNHWVFDRCVFAGNGSDGIQLGTTGASSPQALVSITNCIFWDNAGYGINNLKAPDASVGHNNAFGSNGTNSQNFSRGTGFNDVTLTTDPFTNAAAGDYSLNNTAGGGAACRAAGFPGAFPGGTTTGYLDIGAAQTEGAAAGGGVGPFGPIR